MTDPRFKTLAKLLVEYSTELKRGDRVSLDLIEMYPTNSPSSCCGPRAWLARRRWPKCVKQGSTRSPARHQRKAAADS